MFDKPVLMIPGPTPVPIEVLGALATPMINHRGPEYAALQNEIVAGLKQVFQTESDVLIFPAAGTGGLEAAIVNTLSPGDPVLSVSIGVFGDRWAKIAAAFGAEVSEYNVEWGRAADPDELARRLRERPFKAVLVTHNETSTGVTNNLAALAVVVKEHGALLMVDAISSMLATDLPMDRWGADVVVAGSQKAFCIPPGLTFVGASPAAWELHRRSRMPRFYWDFSAMRKSMEKSQTPYTPALTQLYGLRVALRAILEETLRGSFRRHAALAGATRAGVRALGLELFADPMHYSNSVTAVYAPAGVSPKDLRRVMRQQHGVVIAGGQAKLETEIFRIGHLGAISANDLILTFAALERSLPALGFPVPAGAGVGAVQEVLEQASASPIPATEEMDLALA